MAEGRYPRLYYRQCVANRTVPPAHAQQDLYKPSMFTLLRVACVCTRAHGGFRHIRIVSGLVSNPIRTSTTTGRSRPCNAGSAAPLFYLHRYCPLIGRSSPAIPDFRNSVAGVRESEHVLWRDDTRFRAPWSPVPSIRSFSQTRAIPGTVAIGGVTTHGNRSRYATSPCS